MQGALANTEFDTIRVATRLQPPEGLNGDGSVDSAGRGLLIAGCSA